MLQLTPGWRRAWWGATPAAQAPATKEHPVPAQAALDPATMNEAEFMAYTLTGLREGRLVPLMPLDQAEQLDQDRAINDEVIGEDFSRHPFFY